MGIYDTIVLFRLSELRTVGYRKDKTIVDEQELRRFQQLSIMQQHRDEASKLPPEAAARLVDASYTLCKLNNTIDLLEVLIFSNLLQHAMFKVLPKCC